MTELPVCSGLAGYKSAEELSTVQIPKLIPQFQGTLLCTVDELFPVEEGMVEARKSQSCMAS